MDEQTWMHLLSKQREQEEAMRSQGAARFKKRLLAAVQAGEATQAGAAKKLLQDALLPTEAAMSRRLAIVQPGQKHIAAKWVPLAGVEVCAYLTAMTILDHSSGRMDAHQTAREIGRMVLDDVRASAFEKRAPHLFNYRLKRYKSERYDRKVEALEWTIKHSDFAEAMQELSLSASQKVQLGTWLIDSFLEGTGLIERKGQTRLSGTKRQKMRRETVLELTEEAQQWIQERNKHLLFRFPVILPMLIPPLAWSPSQRGGYRFGQRGTHSLVKKVRKPQEEQLKQAKMPVVYQAVNAMQSTAWRVNTGILSVLNVEDLYLPEPMPPKPEDIDTNHASRRAWKHLAHQVHDRNRVARREAMEKLRVIRMAQDLSHEECFYFPHNLDWRGRVYPLASALQPQGDDLCRALLEFHEGVPLGERGAGWLAVHLCNKLGQTPEGQKVSTMTFEERVQWVSAHHMDIVEVALNPREILWWQQAEEPYSFLAACMEWKRLQEHLYQASAEIATFISHLPVSLDGTANGLQHFSALLRDEIGGAAVNLVPSQRPRDIYSAVADSVNSALEQLVTGGENELARLWLTSGLVNRKLTKRCVMTFSYGSKQYGFNEQLNAYLKGLDEWKTIKQHFSRTADTGKVENRVPAASRLMASCIWSALSSTVVAAFAGMQWLQQCARLVNEAHGSVSWTVPGTGFPVVQRYVSLRRRQVDTWLAGKVFKPSITVETDKADTMKAVNGISPNYIHSLDAAALMLTVCAAQEMGIESFAMVHDSYGTHAGHVEQLAIITREQFIRLYTEFDPLAKIAAQMYNQMSVVEGQEWPRLPSLGNLDIEQVRQSRYFFG